MNKVLTLTAAMLVCASVAMAGGVNLNAGADAFGCAPVAGITNTCTSSTGSIVLVGSVVPSRDLVGFAASGVILDVQSAAATLPDFWRLDACRLGKAVIAFDGTIGTCGTIWDAALGSALPVSAWQYNASLPARIRLNAGAAVAEPYNFTGGAELAVFKLTITKALTTGTGACTGCLTGACIVLNEVSLQEVGVTNYLKESASAGQNYVVYNNANGTSPLCPQSTPTQNRTWGSVKAMYR